MTRKDKLLQKVLLCPTGLAFKDFTTLLTQQGWVLKRQTGSHAIWYSPRGCRLVVQNYQGKAKAYQVKQFLLILEKEKNDEG